MKKEEAKVEGLMVAFGDSPDKDGDVFVKGGVDAKEFLARGHIVKKYTNHPSDVIGQPTMVEEREDGVHVEGVVHPQEIKNLAGPGTELGFGIAGKILEKEEVDGVTLLRRVEVTSLAIMPLSMVTDPRCKCRVTLKRGE